MESETKEKVAASLWATIVELRREEDSLFDRAYAISSTLTELVETWDRLELGPLPDPEVPSCRNVPVRFDEGAGMTERIRAILRAHIVGMTPTAVRDALIATGFDAEGRANLMAEVHTVLKRLVGQKRRIVAEEESGVIYYRYEEPEALERIRSQKKQSSPEKKKAN